MIIEIEEKLNTDDSFADFAHEARQWGRPKEGSEDYEDGTGDESFIGSEGQISTVKVMKMTWRHSRHDMEMQQDADDMERRQDVDDVEMQQVEDDMETWQDVDDVETRQDEGDWF
ncbi:hypothetical protein CY34DRAFT_111024 [Suillus luteus UH-Slu-Lm8-n1]|uniref:Uncharacterized protein n=1 Tax=Suillus luteus UH-Slu-Lm8-n1 TaxID=930992 RepID=A0A0D0ADI8_9AGAM|nr:hypothetical protein CY34DRAFT_111024 [Suillus luteus UH-Slu-Lm8-n1]